MRLEYQILLAVALDLIFGDPRWLPHPVKLIGRLATFAEMAFRKMIKNLRIAGVATVFVVVGTTILATYGLISGARSVHPYAGDLVSILLLWTGIAAKDMVRHSSDVVDALNSGSLTDARERVAMICGRDTDRLDESDVARATVESVAENMVDGVVAPLFYAAIGGALGIMAYKAVNTLDSSFGYKNREYLKFGWASAKLDDIANFIPSRLAALLVPPAAMLLLQSPAHSLKVFLRDRLKHPSPNAGQAEAAVAGALGIQLGGLSYYSGIPSNKPPLGDPLAPVGPEHVVRANALLLMTSGLALALLLTVRLSIVG
ncbi:MAG: adenosylcobinamide-phosphate synthase CbiB [Desulfomonilaceae bacterium]